MPLGSGSQPLSHPFCLWGYSEKCAPQKRTLTWLRWHSDLGLPAPELWERLPPFIILWCFVMVAWVDQDTQEEPRLQFKSPGRIPPCSGGCWRRKWLPAPVFLPARSHGQGNLWGCNPWGRESWTWLSDWTMTTGEVRLVVCPSLQLIGWGSLKL